MCSMYTDARIISSRFVRFEFVRVHHARARTRTHAHARARTRTHAHARARTNAHARTNARARARARARTHARTYPPRFPEYTH